MHPLLIIVLVILVCVSVYNFRLAARARKALVLQVTTQSPSFFYVPDMYYDGVLYVRVIDSTADSVSIGGSQTGGHQAHFLKAIDPVSGKTLWKKSAYFAYQAQDGSTHLTGSVLSPIEQIFFDVHGNLMVSGSGRTFEFDKKTGDLAHCRLIESQENKRFLDDRYIALVAARDFYVQKIDPDFSGLNVKENEIALYSAEKNEKGSIWDVTFGPVSEDDLDGEVLIQVDARSGKVIQWSFR